MKRKIAIVTGTRAEYGIFKPLLQKIIKSNSLELKLIASGMHLLEEHGLTINEIKKDDFRIDALVKMYSNNKTNPAYHAKALAKGIDGFVNVLLKIKPSVLVVLGDRLEALAATLAAATLRIPIAHIHGGDKTDDAHIDEGIRNSISQFAHIHFTATKGHTNRLIRMGEEPWRIFQTGALGLDSILNQIPISKEKIFNELKINKNEKTIVCIFHPNDLEIKIVGKHMHEILESIKELTVQAIVIYPNNDAGSQDIIKEIKKCACLPSIKVFPSLTHDVYVSLLRHADALIGNSSSGIIETPALGLPVVNIGLRNTGREHGENTLFVPANKKMIIKAIKRVLYDENFKTKARKGRNPYGDGTASDKIVNILTKINIDKKLLRKIKTR